MRRLFVIICVLATLAGVGIPALADETVSVQATVEERDPYRPVKTEAFTWGDFDVIHIQRIYQLSPVDDPAGIPTKDFEDSGWVYHMVEMTREEEVGTDSRQITRTVTKFSDTDDTEKILRKLDATISVETEDGYSGELRLDHTSVRVEAEGYKTRDDSISATRLYPNLADADLSLIPKTIEDDGRTLSLDDVEWESAWQTEADGAFIRYSATATYVGTTSTRYATGYTVTANYTGKVSRSNVEMITYTVEFAPVREVDPVVEPPQPKDDEKSGHQEARGDSGQRENSGENSVESGGDSVPATDDSPDFPSGNNPEAPSIGQPSMERPQSSPDYSRLKRTLLNCALLLLLAAAAFGIAKYKKWKGESIS